MHGLEFIQTRIKALRQDSLFEEALRALEKNGGPIERATVELLRELADGNATKKAVYRLVEKGIVEERGRGEYACRTADDLRCECGGRLVFDERHYEYVCLDCGLVQEAYLTSEGSKILSDSHTPIKPFRTKKDFRYNGGKVFLQRSTLTKVLSSLGFNHP